jgi:hypothetical protein
MKLGTIIREINGHTTARTAHHVGRCCAHTPLWLLIEPLVSRHLLITLTSTIRM